MYTRIPKTSETADYRDETAVKTAVALNPAEPESGLFRAQSYTPQSEPAFDTAPLMPREVGNMIVSAAVHKKPRSSALYAYLDGIARHERLSAEIDRRAAGGNKSAPTFGNGIISSASKEDKPPKKPDKPKP